MYEINEKHKTKNVHYTDPNDCCQASKLTLQITPLLSLNSLYPISSAVSLAAFGFTPSEWQDCYCRPPKSLGRLSASKLAALPQESATPWILMGVPHAVLGAEHLALEGQEALHKVLSNYFFLRASCGNSRRE